MKHHDNYGNRVSQREIDNSSETKLKVMDDCDLKDRKIKIAVMKKLNKIKNKISERKLNELSDQFKEQKKYFIKQTEIPKENQKEIVELRTQ